jgi:hypothetical protein
LEAVGDKVREAEDEDDALGEIGPDDAGDDGKGGDDAVVRPVAEVGEVVAEQRPTAAGTVGASAVSSITPRPQRPAGAAEDRLPSSTRTKGATAGTAARVSSKTSSGTVPSGSFNAVRTGRPTSAAERTTLARR